MKSVRRRRKVVGVSGIIHRHGGRVNILVMGATVGGILFLLMIQGSFFWPSSSNSNGITIASTRAAVAAADMHFHLKGKEQWETQRKLFLDTILQSSSWSASSSSETLRIKTALPVDGTTSTTAVEEKQNMLCSALPRNTSAKTLWTKYIGAILAASQHPDDPNFIHEEWTKRLLAELPPSLLHAATTTSGALLPNMSRVLKIVQNKLQNPETAPPLRIAVVGGTFAEGEGCSIASVRVPEGSIMANPTYCAWPYRLQAFLNTLLLGSSTTKKGFSTGQSNSTARPPTSTKWVEVSNLAEEGTDTGFMIPLMRNWIYPKHLLPHGPDIIVNAYGRYDYESYGEVRTTTNLKDTIISEMNTFVRAVEQSQVCDRRENDKHRDGTLATTTNAAPHIMIIHMDDVHVDLEKPIFSIRHKDAFDRAMHADGQKDFAMAGHMAMTWVLAFGLLEATLQHCANHNNESKSDEIAIESRSSRELSPMASFSETTTTTDCKDASTGGSSCPFRFFASPQGTVTKVTEFQRYLSPYIVGSNGWEVLSDMSTGWSRKTGLVAIHPNARIVIKVTNIQKSVRYFHLMTLKSNVDPWKSGKIRVRIGIVLPGKEGAPIETSFEISGYHSSSTDNHQPEHITNHYNINFEDHKAPIGSDIMLSLELIEGTSFKVLGIMLCQ